ncbi:hypothetical protein [Kitasatospora sp. NPDC094015]|uniref:hypothetical protein n=1 Tax=Kitasatospora sp. NPDC094015 TaxID=3155205 RepID=UPI00331803F6
MSAAIARPLTGDRRTRTLLIANAAFAAVSALACLLAVASPALLLPDAGAGADFYAEAYAARQLPLSAAILLLVATGRRRGLLPLLAVSAVAQLGDALLGITHGNPGMTIGATVGTALHLAGARRLGRAERSGVIRSVPPRTVHVE